MEETTEEMTETANTFGRFSPSIIYDYIKDGVYPDSFSKADKGSLRKRAKFFTVKDTELYYQSRSKAGKTPHDL